MHLGPPEPLRSSLLLMGAGPGNGGSVWTPLALTPMIWLDATQLGLSDGAAVAQFTDLSGNGRHFVQATTANKPTYRSSGINSLASVEADGVDDNMTLAAFGTQAAWSAMFVFKQTAADTGEDTFWSVSDYPSASSYKMIEKVSGVDGIAGITVNANPGSSLIGITVAAGNVRVCLLTANASSLVFRIGATTQNGSASNHSRANDLMRLFARGDGNYSPLMIGELMFFDRVLDTTDRNLLRDYFLTKWGASIA